MQFYVGVTDNQWFANLAELQPDEVNFWRPSGQGFGAVEQWSPFLFKLHSPQNFIVGGGFFVRFLRLPLSFVWDAFGEKNGAPTYPALYEQIMKYRGQPEPDPEIGCIILAQPFFFDRQDWIPQPKDWSQNIVTGKTYDTGEPIGAGLWEQVQQRLQRYSMPSLDEEKEIPAIAEPTARYGSEYPVRPRLGQGAFRALVTDVYQRRCAVTAERTLPVLEAAHIKPYTQSGPHDVRNGLLLRADIHILFERGYMTVTDDFVVEVSGRIKEEFENGGDYYAFHGEKLVVLPSRLQERPGPEYIAWHNNHVFRS